MLNAVIPDQDTAVSREALAGRRSPIRAGRPRRRSLIPLRAALQLAVVSRPGAWVPAALVYAGGVTISHMTTAAWPAWAGLVFVTMPMGLIVFGINDIADIRSDALNRRKGGAWGAVVRTAERRLLAVAAVTCAVTFLLADFLTGHYLAGLSVLGISLLACAYSLRPVRLKARPVLDSLSNGFWVVCMFCCGYYASTAGFVSRAPAVHIFVVLLLCGAAVHALTTLLDREVDEQVGDTTIGVYLGTRRTLGLAAILFAACFAMVTNLEMKVYFAAATATLATLSLHPPRRTIKFLVTAVLFALPPALAAFDIAANIR
jgi:4-hydroxybenzoate polyprenyltransferase